jgi:hypothetical protein
MIRPRNRQLAAIATSVLLTAAAIAAAVLLMVAVLAPSVHAQAPSRQGLPSPHDPSQTRVEEFGGFPSSGIVAVDARSQAPAVERRITGPHVDKSQIDSGRRHDGGDTHGAIFAVSYFAHATGNCSSALGDASLASGASSSARRFGAAASGNNGTSVGDGSYASAGNSSLLGYHAKATGTSAPR